MTYLCERNYNVRCCKYKKYMIVTKIDVHASLRSMVVGEVLSLPLDLMNNARVAASRVGGRFHIYKFKDCIRVKRYE